MEIIATIIFACLKSGAYFAFLHFFAPKRSAIIVFRNAVIRLVCGVLIGMLLFGAFSQGRNLIPAYLTAILIGRLLLWFLLFKLFYKPISNRDAIKLSFGGTLVSYIVDVPAFFSIITIVGGIC